MLIIEFSTVVSKDEACIKFIAWKTLFVVLKRLFLSSRETLAKSKAHSLALGQIPAH